MSPFLSLPDLSLSTTGHGPAASDSSTPSIGKGPGSSFAALLAQESEEGAAGQPHAPASRSTSPVPEGLHSPRQGVADSVQAPAPMTPKSLHDALQDVGAAPVSVPTLQGPPQAPSLRLVAPLLPKPEDGSPVTASPRTSPGVSQSVRSTPKSSAGKTDARIALPVAVAIAPPALEPERPEPAPLDEATVVGTTAALPPSRGSATQPGEDREASADVRSTQIPDTDPLAASAGSTSSASEPLAPAASPALDVEVKAVVVPAIRSGAALPLDVGKAPPASAASAARPAVHAAGRAESAGAPPIGARNSESSSKDPARRDDAETRTPRASDSTQSSASRGVSPAPRAEATAKAKPNEERSSDATANGASAAKGSADDSQLPDDDAGSAQLGTTAVDMTTASTPALRTDANPLTPVSPPTAAAVAAAPGRAPTIAAVVSAANHAVIQRVATGNLDVPELGRVEVRAAAVSGHVDIDVSSERAETHAILHSSAGALASDLRQAEVPVRQLRFHDTDAGSASPQAREQQRSPQDDRPRAGHEGHDADREEAGVDAVSARPVRIVL